MLVKLVFVGLFVVPGVLLAIFTFIRKLNSPEKSLYFCLLNTGLGPLRFLKLGPYKHSKIDVANAMKYAEKKTKLSDWGSKDFCDSYNAIMQLPTQKSMKYHNLGFIMARLELNMTMVRRLKMIDYLKENKKILDVPFRAPVFVLGLPRTGTTFLHRLLSLDPTVRAPLLWELLAPVPAVAGDASGNVTGEMEADKAKRKKYIKKLIDSRKSAGDYALEHIHEIGHDLPEECIMSLSDEIPVLLQQFYTDYLNIDTFFKVVSPERTVQAYKWYRTVLQLLMWQDGDVTAEKRWMLKCPIHLFYPKEIAAAFPEAKLVWTHRHPTSAVPSLCSLLKSIHQVYYEGSCRDDAKLGRHICDLSANMLEKAPKDIEESGLPNTNVLYDDLVKDPVAVVRKIYKDFGWTVSTEYETALNNYLAEDMIKREAMKKSKAEKGDALHTYSPKEFSLSDEELKSGKFAAYAKKFGVPEPKK